MIWLVVNSAGDRLTVDAQLGIETSLIGRYYGKLLVSVGPHIITMLTLCVHFLTQSITSWPLSTMTLCTIMKKWKKHYQLNLHQQHRKKHFFIMGQNRQVFALIKLSM